MKPTAKSLPEIYPDESLIIILLSLGDSGLSSAVLESAESA